MKVLITGANGFIGSFLSQSLLDNGYEVRVLQQPSIDPGWIKGLNVKYFYANLSDTEVLRQAVEDVDYVYHLAGLVKAHTTEQYYEVNLEGTRNLVNQVLEGTTKLKRFVFVSSQAAAGPSSLFKPVNEHDLPCPISDYGRSKLAAENYILSLEMQLPFTIIRPSSVYGPRDREIYKFFKIVNRGIIPKIGRKEKYFSLIYVEDLVLGILAAAEHEKSIGKTYFLSAERPYSWDEVAHEALKVYEKKGATLFIPHSLLSGFAHLAELYTALSKRATILNRQKFDEIKQNYWICSSKQAGTDFNFSTPTTLQRGVAKTIGWYKQNNWL